MQTVSAALTEFWDLTGHFETLSCLWIAGGRKGHGPSESSEQEQELLLEKIFQENFHVEA